jgi:hypothetical protein
MRIDIDRALRDHDGVSSNRHHARRRDRFAGADVESAPMEIALDDIVFDEALRQGTRSMRTGVICNKNGLVEIEDG